MKIQRAIVLGLIFAQFVYLGCEVQPTGEIPGEFDRAESETQVTDESTSTGEWTGDSSSDGLNERLDIGHYPGPSCNRRIDFLFVIDNSGSMGPRQEALIASFPGFINSIQQVGGVAADPERFHIMVVDTDGVNDACYSQCQTNPEPPEACAPVHENQACNWSAPNCLELCEAWNSCAFDENWSCDIYGDMGCTQLDRLGMGRIETPEGVSCGFQSGGRFINASQSNPPLNETFACAANVGTGGDSFERTLQSMANAITDQDTIAHGCNQNFLRPDSLLVVTFITDEDDSSSTGTPGALAGIIRDFMEARAAANKSNPENYDFQDDIVMLGIYNEDYSSNIDRFLDYFKNVHTGDVNAESYSSFFAEAAAKVNSACDPYYEP